MFKRSMGKPLLSSKTLMPNPALNRTANKLRLLVPSALRATAAGYANR